MSTYFQVLLFSFFVPFIFSFHPKILFYKKWASFIKANLIVTIPFLIWDEIFVRSQVWGFSKIHLSDISFLNLPIEEILFFVIIPYCCVFTYDVFCKLNLNKSKIINIITLVIGLSLLFLGVLFHEKLYTSITFIFLALVLIILFFSKNHFLPTFYLTYIVISFTFFIIVNGVLTGGFTGGPDNQPPVFYNDQENLDIRFWTIPIEDFFYSMLMLITNIWLFEIFKKRKKKTI